MPNSDHRLIVHSASSKAPTPAPSTSPKPGSAAPSVRIKSEPVANGTFSPSPATVSSTPRTTLSRSRSISSTPRRRTSATPTAGQGTKGTMGPPPVPRGWTGFVERTPGPSGTSGRHRSASRASSEASRATTPLRSVSEAPSFHTATGRSMSAASEATSEASTVTPYSQNVARDGTVYGSPVRNFQRPKSAGIGMSKLAPVTLGPSLPDGLARALEQAVAAMKAFVPETAAPVATMESVLGVLFDHRVVQEVIVASEDEAEFDDSGEDFAIIEPSVNKSKLVSGTMTTIQSLIRFVLEAGLTGFAPPAPTRRKTLPSVAARRSTWWAENASSLKTLVKTAAPSAAFKLEAREVLDVLVRVWSDEAEFIKNELSKELIPPPRTSTINTLLRNIVCLSEIIVDASWKEQV